jgi:hypothetical protein
MSNESLHGDGAVADDIEDDGPSVNLVQALTWIGEG